MTDKIQSILREFDDMEDKVQAWVFARALASELEDWAKQIKPEMDGPKRYGDMVAFPRKTTRYICEGAAINEAKERLKYLEGVAKSIIDPVADTVTGLIIEPAQKVEGSSIVLQKYDTFAKQNPKAAAEL